MGGFVDGEVEELLVLVLGVHVVLDDFGAIVLVLLDVEFLREVLDLA